MSVSRIDDLWRRTDRATGQLVPTARDGRGKRWLARYKDEAGKEHTKVFARKPDAKAWLDSVTTAVGTGSYVDPRDAKTTVEQWCTTWLVGYGTRRVSTVRQAEVHVAKIKEEFGTLPLSSVRPSAVRNWMAGLKEAGYSDSYVYALHGRLSQIMGDAVHDGLLTRNPCSRRTSPGAAKQRPYVATTEQVWALYEAFSPHLAPAVLLGAFVGLRTAEAVGLRVEDVDYMRGIVHPRRQYPDQPLKTDTSRTAVPIAPELALDLSAAVARFGSDFVVTDGAGGQSSPWAIDRAIRGARKKVKGLPPGFRFHDLRHYLASLLIASGADVKVVQARLRHASATTTLNTYTHLWPDSDESTRQAISAVFTARAVAQEPGRGGVGRTPTPRSTRTGTE